MHFELFWTQFDLVHEPLTCFFCVCSQIGGDKRTRTADICLARAALYQLSYTPEIITKVWCHRGGLCWI